MQRESSQWISLPSLWVQEGVGERILSPGFLVSAFKAANPWNKARAHRFPREWILSFSYLWLRIVKEYLSSSSTSLTLWKSERKESALPQKSGISVPRGMNLVWVFFLLSLCLFQSRVSRSPVKQLTPERTKDSKDRTERTGQDRRFKHLREKEGSGSGERILSSVFPWNTFENCYGLNELKEEIGNIVKGVSSFSFIFLVYNSRWIKEESERICFPLVTVQEYRWIGRRKNPSIGSSLWICFVYSLVRTSSNRIGARFRPELSSQVANLSSSLSFIRSLVKGSFISSLGEGIFLLYCRVK